MVFSGFLSRRRVVKQGSQRVQVAVNRCWTDVGGIFFGLTENLSKSVEISQESRNLEASDEIWKDILKITLGISFTSNEMIVISLKKFFKGSWWLGCLVGTGLRIPPLDFAESIFGRQVDSAGVLHFTENDQRVRWVERATPSNWPLEVSPHTQLLGFEEFFASKLPRFLGYAFFWDSYIGDGLESLTPNITFT